MGQVNSNNVVKEIVIICKRESCFHSLQNHRLHAVCVIITDILVCLLQQVPRALKSWQRLFDLVESLNIHETIKMCYSKVFDKASL